MTEKAKAKRCRRCEKLRPVTIFCRQDGWPSTQGQTCFDCHIQEVKEEEVAMLLQEQAKIPKLKILFGEWWQHYAPPSEFTYTLYREFGHCLYCGGELGPIYVPKELAPHPVRGRAHLDHMDPIAKGGEDSIRNAVYACDPCNLAKRSRLFVDWLNVMPPDRAALARKVYVDKHGHEPEAFVPGPRSWRTTGALAELLMDDRVLRKLYPKPIVSGPPNRDDGTIVLEIRGLD